MKVIKHLNQRNEKKNTLTKKTTKKDINEKLKKGKNRYSSNKLYKLNGNNCIDDFKVNKLENNLEIKKNIEKNNENNIIKFNNIYNISYIKNKRNWCNKIIFKYLSKYKTRYCYY